MWRASSERVLCSFYIPRARFFSRPFFSSSHLSALFNTAKSPQNTFLTLNTGGRKCMSFGAVRESLGGEVSLTPARSKSNIMSATHPTNTRQRKNTDKAAEALH